MAGAGLSGLVATTLLHEAGRTVVVVEARSRVGGRIMTVAADDSGSGTELDLGATWTWPDQPEIRALAGGLGIDLVPQDRQGLAVVDSGPEMPLERIELPAQPGEWRFVGGAQQLCERLAERLAPGCLRLDTRLESVSSAPAGAGTLAVDVTDAVLGDQRLHASFVVVALPPRLVAQHISFSPPLPDPLVEVMRATPTWMGNALKCVAVYESPFWRSAGLSGTAFSSAGPLLEVHDASSPGDGGGALWGFLSADHAFRDLDPETRVEAVLVQLERMFGAAAAEPVGYFERDWSGDPNTNDEVVWIEGPLLAYGHQAFSETQMGGRLLWAGAETVAEGGGHMEGAVRSGRRAAALVLSAYGPPG